MITFKYHKIILSMNRLRMRKTGASGMVKEGGGWNVVGEIGKFRM